MRSSAFRSLFVAVCATVAATTVACSVSTTGNSITLKTQTKYTGDSAVTKTASGAYAAGDVIEIENANGDVQVTAVAGLTKISVSTTPFAFADGDKKSDGSAAIADVVNTITIDESTAHKFYIHCSTASAAHGSAGTGTTGCENFTVQVPAGAVDQPLSLKATAHNGELTGSGLVGSVVLHSDNGPVTGSVTPAVGSAIEVSSGNGDVSLAVPADFKADSVTLTPGGSGSVTSTDFPDLNDATSPHKQSGGAKSIVVKTELGSVTLKKQ